MITEKMIAPVMALCNLIEEIKTKITDAQYMAMLEQLRKIHSEYTWNFQSEPHLVTPDKVIRLTHSIIRSGVKNPGKLAHILRKKGFGYDTFLYNSFKEWMNDISVTVNNNTVTIE